MYACMHVCMHVCMYACHVSSFRDLDLFVAMNDRWTYEDDGMDNKLMLQAVERILRLASNHSVAVAMLSVFMGRVDVVEESYHRVCAHYGVPLLSYRSAVIDQVKHAFSIRQYDPEYHVNGSRFSPLFNCIGIEDLHPKFQTHLVIAQFVSDFFEKAYTFYTDDSYHSVRTQVMENWQKEGDRSILFGGTLIDDGEDNDSHSICHPIQTFYSSLSTDRQLVTKHFQNEARETQGWRYIADRPGKPKGWVSDGENKKLYGKLLLPVVLTTGKITISYLKSYNNSGQFEVYLQPGRSQSVNFLQTDPKLLIAHPNLVGCCVGPYQTLRAKVDTFDNTTNTSVIVSRTFQFDRTGLLNVVVQRVRLPAEERKRRSGDKVKIVSIRSC